jgi:hypothetical protein
VFLDTNVVVEPIQRLFDLKDGVRGKHDDARWYHRRSRSHNKRPRRSFGVGSILSLSSLNGAMNLRGVEKSLVLNLMQRFNVVWPLNRTMGWLVSPLLPAEPPSFVAKRIAAMRRWRREWHINHRRLPSDLLTSVLAATLRVNDRCDVDAVWRQGVLFSTTCAPTMHEHFDLDRVDVTLRLVTMYTSPASESSASHSTLDAPRAIIVLDVGQRHTDTDTVPFDSPSSNERYAVCVCVCIDFFGNTTAILIVVAKCSRRR